MSYEKESTVSDTTFQDEESEAQIESTNDSTIEEKPEQKRAGFWLRFVAYIIDVIIISSINGIIISPILFMNSGEPIEISFWTLNGILALVVYYLYFAVMTKLFQQTLGKMIFGIKVIQQENQTLTWTDIFYREVVGRILHNVFFFLKLMYLVVAFTDEKQGIHDMIGNTRVVYV